VTSKRIVLDSSCWLEVFGQTDRADLYASAVMQPQNLIVPVITIYEVIKKLAREFGDAAAIDALIMMKQGVVVELSEKMAIDATEHMLPLADSLIYTAAQAYGATLWTQDQHFEGLAGVKYFSKSADKE
jgi:toxin FitB